MKTLIAILHGRYRLLFPICLMTAGLTGCVSLSPDIVTAPEKIRVGIQQFSNSEENRIRELSNIDEQNTDEYEQLLVTYVEMCKYYRHEALIAARQHVLEEFDDDAFRLINVGLQAQLESNSAYINLRLLEADARAAFHRAITTELQHPMDPNAYNNRLLCEQNWEDKLRLLISTQNGVRMNLIVQLAASRESFRATVDKTFDTLAADQSSIPVLPPYQASGIGDSTDMFLQNAQAFHSSIDGSLINLSAALQFSTEFHVLDACKFIQGAGGALGTALTSNSLIGALAGDALKKAAPTLVSDITTAQQDLTAQAQSTVAASGQAAAASPAIQQATTSATTKN